MDGSLMAPHGGSPPDGYIVDPKDSNRFIKDEGYTKACFYKEPVFKNTGCCGVQLTNKCTLKGKFITKEDCNECKVG